MTEVAEQIKTEEAPKDLNDPRLFVNRELSLLEFQRRVLEEAQDENNPLLERVKFLSIVGSNLDEFFMVRVAGLNKQIDAGCAGPAAGWDDPRRAAGRHPQALPTDYGAVTRLPWRKTCCQRSIRPASISWITPNWMSGRRPAWTPISKKVVFPVLTPLAFDPGHPFPHISNLSLNLAVVIRDEDGEEHFARVKVPDTLPRLVPIKRSSGSVRKDGTVPYHHYFVWLEQVIAANSSSLFPGWRSSKRIPSGSLAMPTWRSRSWKQPTCWRPWRRACASAGLAPWCA